MRRSPTRVPALRILRVCLFVEPEHDLRALDEDRPADEIRILHHQRDRVLLRLRQRPLLEDRAPRAHEIEEPARVDVLFEELPRRRCLVDIDLVDVESFCVQKTSGVLAGRSGEFRIEGRFRHTGRIMEITAQVSTLKAQAP